MPAGLFEGVHESHGGGLVVAVVVAGEGAEDGVRVPLADELGEIFAHRCFVQTKAAAGVAERAVVVHVEVGGSDFCLGLADFGFRIVLLWVGADAGAVCCEDEAEHAAEFVVQC